MLLSEQNPRVPSRLTAPDSGTESTTLDFQKTGNYISRELSQAITAYLTRRLNRSSDSRCGCAGNQFNFGYVRSHPSRCAKRQGATIPVPAQYSPGANSNLRPAGKD